MGRLSALITAVVDGTTAAATARTGHEVSRTETRRYERPPALAVDSHNGRIAVRGEDRDDVAVTVTKRAATEDALEDVRVRERGGTEGAPLRLEAVFERPVVDAAVEFDIAVPAGLPVERIETANGRIDVRGVGGDPRLRSKNGRIEAREIDGYVDLRSTNGRLVARDVAGIDGAETVNGAIDLEVESIRGETTIAATNGRIDLLAGPELDATVRLETTVGRIEASAFGRSASGVGGATVTGTLGDGRDRLAVSTTAGALEFDRRA
ncbi:hypothetical protein [Natrononativus amylolyticus]|uniref:hypothetical protein n=1 Tax=Natrononativus amylolyticus TaxID=2963434 RepID=UPI0020CDDE8F|nr:hypothetical protein [Natrononativus amylolyticus]